MPPPVAVIVSDCNAAAGAAAAASTYSVATPDGVTDAGLNVADTPFGSPLALNCTRSWKPLTEAMLSVMIDLPPGARYCVEGETSRVKSGGPLVAVGEGVGDAVAVPVDVGVLVSVGVLVTVGVNVVVGVSVCVRVGVGVWVGGVMTTVENEMVKLWLIPPPLAITSTENCPGSGASAASESVSIDVPGGVKLVGVNLPVSPVGSPVV